MVAEKFVKGNPEVKFCHIASAFLKWYGQTTERAIGETTIKTGKLATGASFADMTPALGEQRVLTNSQFYWILVQQPRGEAPDGKNRRLLVDGHANFLRVLDKDGIERSVRASWSHGSGWIVNADGLGDDYSWYAINQVLSRKSDLKILEPSVPA